MIVKIETGVALPPRSLNLIPRQKDPASMCGVARAMSPGESVFFDNSKSAKGLVNGINRAHGKGAGSIRKVEGGWRVWRVK